MPNKLTIVLSGRDDPSRIAALQFILVEYLNKKIKKQRFSIQKLVDPDKPKSKNQENVIVDSFNNDEIISVLHPNQQLDNIASAYSVKIYNPNDAMKKVCMDFFGLDHMQCYGSDEDQNSTCPIIWDDLFDQLRIKHSRPKRGNSKLMPASGNMTCKEVLEVISNDIFRRIDPNSMSRALYNLIEKDGYELSLVNGASFNSEITIGGEIGAKTVRLLKANRRSKPDELENLSLGEFGLVLDNQELTTQETNKKLRRYLTDWFAAKRLFN